MAAVYAAQCPGMPVFPVQNGRSFTVRRGPRINAGNPTLLDSTKLQNTLHQHCPDVGFEEVMATPLPGEPCMKPIRIKIRGVTSSVLDWNWREELLDEPHQPDKTHF